MVGKNAKVGGRTVYTTNKEIATKTKIKIKNRQLY